MIREEKNIIGLCGRQSSGKTMLAQYLVENMGYKRIYVAQALKELCSKLLGMSIDEMNKKKNVETEYLLTEDHAKYISDETQIPFDVVIEELKKINNTLHTTRQAFQFIGTDLIRKYNPNWHIEKMLATMKPNEKYVVDDVRFPNEVQALQYHGSTLIFIVRPISTNINHHKSEESINWHEFDNLIINNQPKQHVINQLVNIIENGSNEYADKYVNGYKTNPFVFGSNITVKITKADDPMELTVFDKSIGWILGEFNAIDNPLEIEDFKFKL